MIYKTKEELVIALKSIDGDLYIAGAGTFGQIFADYLNIKYIPWNGFVDITPANLIKGKKVFSYDYFSKINKKVYILISSNSYSYEILNQLKKARINDSDIIMPYNQQIIMDIWEEIEGVYSHLKKLRYIKHIYNNQRCFIIGNGPSLLIDDLERIKEISFACNSIYALYNETNWRPTYYCVSDTTAVKVICDTKKLGWICKNCVGMFTSLSQLKQIKEFYEIFDKVYFYKSIHSRSSSDEPVFSDDIEKFVSGDGLTVTYDMLQIACYMGFTEIYLLGIDFSFAIECDLKGEVIFNNIANHNKFIEKEELKYQNIVKKRFGYPYIAYKEKQLWSYQIAKKYADANGIKIYNATRGGKLEVFPRVDFDSLF